MAEAGRTIARYGGSYVDSGFTRDDSHVYALDAAGMVVAVDVGSGAVLPQRLECHCDRVFPLTGTTVGWWQEPDGFLRADLLSPKTVARLRVSLPAPDPVAPGNVLSAPRLLAADERTLLVDRTEAPRGAAWGINHLSVVDTETGAARTVDTAETRVNTPFGAAAIRPDGRAAAVAAYIRDGSTCGTARLVRIELPQGRTETFDLPQLSSCSAIADLGWQGAAPIATGLFWEPGAPDRLTATAVWTRHGNRWDRQGGNDTLRRAALTPTVTLEIRRTGRDRVHTEQAGALLVLDGTEARVLAHEVIDMCLPHGIFEPPGTRPPPRLWSAPEDR
ncbi:hypothetical protein [Nocardia blacklockiae]|uniref:hypothetical protein n=1 Tax=Nocardia blacklockiae TaxID=480036 RepID=UPI0018938CDE|nr:hypothetical protein [Nocardia blacklockiae]MBF6172562.1 hypothetical protein [Nocardia blacklockiae]